MNNLLNIILWGAFYCFCWIGLGTPFIWLRRFDATNATTYNFASYGILLALFCVFIVICIITWREVLRKLWQTKILSVFLIFLGLSLLWSPLSLFEKATIGFSLSLCVAIALTCVVVIGHRRSWALVMFALCGIMLPTLVAEMTPRHLPLEGILISYIGGFSSFFILANWLLVRAKVRSLWTRFNGAAILLAFGMILFPLFHMGTDVSADATNLGWIWLRPDHGLFINPNLYSRSLQVLLIASLVTALNFGSLSRQPQVTFSVLSLFIALLCAFVLFDHRASAGRFVLLIALVTFIILLFARELYLKFPCLGSINSKSVTLFFTVCVASAALVFAIDIQVIVVEAFQRASTMHSMAPRLRIWQTALPLLNGQDLWIGDGLGGFWQGIPKLAQADPFLSVQAHAHSSIVDLVLQTGFVGLVLFVLVILTRIVSLKSLVAGNRFVSILTLLLALAGTLAMNLFESAFLPVSSAALLPFTLFLVIMFGTSNEHTEGAGRIPCHFWWRALDYAKCRRFVARDPLPKLNPLPRALSEQTA